MVAQQPPTLSCKLAFACALLFAALSSYSQPRFDFSNPTRLTHRQGLPDNRVLSMAQDGDGFMWFGTYDGLCRFDGSVVEVFKNDPNDSTSISNNFIRSLFFDKTANQLWIGTQKGLNVLDLKSGKFRYYFHHPGDPCSIPDDEIGRAIFKDRQGVIWIASGRKGFMRYNPWSDDFDSFAYPYSSHDTGERLERVNHIDQIAQDLQNDSILWIGTSSGLLRFNKMSCRFKRYYEDLGDKQLNIRANSTYCMYLHPNGKIYLGTWGNYLMVFDPKMGSFMKKSATLDLQRFPEGHGVVYDIIKKSGQELWVTTNHGLCVYSILHEAVTSELLNNPDFEMVVGAAFQDDRGRLWGRSDTGVRIYDPLNCQFQHFPLEKEMGEDCRPMQAVEAPGKGKLYVNCAGGHGLYLLDRMTGKWTLIPPPPRLLKTGNRFFGRALLQLQDGRLLVVEESMLFTLSPDGKSLTPFPIQPGGDDVRYMTAMQDSKGRVWIGSVDGGLFMLDLLNGVSKNLSDELLLPSEKGTSPRVGDVFEDRNGNLWVDVRGGISIYDSHKNRFINHAYHPNKAEVFNHIGGFEVGLDSSVLIAGGWNGVGVADPEFPEHGIQRKLDVPGNPSFYANGMLKDRSGNLWMDGEKNLLKLNLPTLELSRFDGFDGLAFKGTDPEMIKINELSLLRSGEVLIAYSDDLGVGIFHPDSIQKNRELPRPYLTSFSVHDEVMERGSALFRRKGFTLPFASNFFSFEFSAIGFTHPHRIRYMYKLEGIDPGWVYPDAGRRYASYSGIWEGKYLLRIRAANGDGVWNEEEFTLPVVIMPPWHRTWWAYTAYIALLAAAGYFAHKMLKNRWLLKMELDMEHREAERLKELDAVKTRLYTNITHEFRTPLTIISGMADEIKEHPLEWLIDGTEMIKRNSRQLLHLVNQMLDLRKLETGKMTVDMVNGNVLPFLKYLFESFHSLASSKGIELRFVTSLPDLTMDYDAEKLQKIVSNLLSNALKFTPAGGQVELKLEIEQLEVDGKLYPPVPQLLISVSDTGIGIPQEKIPFIFDHFYQVDDTHSRPSEGTGIGLALTQELVKLLGGTISLESQKEKGSTFKVMLPLTDHSPKSQSTETQAIDVEATLPKPPVDNSESGTAKRSRTEKSAEIINPTVLIIEDNADVVIYLKTCLWADYQLLVATNGKSGLEQAIENTPDLILSDVMMPEMDGFEVCKALKNDDRTSHIPVILLTAKADMESRLEGLDCGADAYLAKPFEPRELHLRIRNLLELRKKMQIYYLALTIGQSAKAETLQKGQVEKREDTFVQKARAIVEQNLDDAQFSTEELGKLLAMSRSQLHRKLTALTGLSPNHFIRYIRLGQARQRLLETDDNIAEIAYGTGFSDPGYFSRVFRQEYEMTPKEWRDLKGAR